MEETKYKEEKNEEKADAMETKEEVRFRGKVAIWFYAVLIGANALIFWGLWDDAGKMPDMVFAIMGFFIVNIVYVPMIVINDVVLTQDTLKLRVGFFRENIKIAKILRVRRTHTPIAGAAASLDRIFIQALDNQTLCAVKEKERFFAELKKRNPNITFL